MKNLTYNTGPVSQLAERIASRIASAGGMHLELEHGHIRELAHAVAWNWMEETGRTEALPAEWLPRVCRALSACGASATAALLMLFDTQLVRPAAWVFHGPRSFWILDCDRLALLPGERIPLLMDRGLATILNRMAPLWDRDGGGGVLGLRGAEDLAETMAGNVARRHRLTRAPLGELRQGVADRLAVLARRRGWRQTPEVILLPTHRS